MKPAALLYLVAIAAVILLARAYARRQNRLVPPPPIAPVSDEVQIPVTPLHIPNVRPL